MTISASNFRKTVIVGLIATFVMTLTGFWQSAIGLATLDVGAMMAASMSAGHPDAPYSLVGGNLVHFANGIVLALAYVVFVAPLIRSNWIVKGLVYTVITTALAVVVVVPAAMGVGVFFSNTPAPALMTLSSLAAHAAYALTLTLGLKVAGVSAVESAQALPRTTALRSAA